MELVTGENDSGRRLDRILRKALPCHPLPLLHRLIRQGKVFADGKRAKANDRLKAGVTIIIPSLKNTEKPDSSVPDLPLPDIIWQSKGLLAVNKPSGLAVHGDSSLDKMVLSFLRGKISRSLSFTPGPLHRLDKPSSGIVVFSENIEGARLFSALMRERKIKKTYLAVIEGSLKHEETWEDCLVRDKKTKKTFVSSESKSGKNAITKVTPIAAFKNYSLIKAEISTGRTHQIRAQAAFHGLPLAGDIKYGGHGKDGLFLHAWKMEFLDVSLEAPPPKAFNEFLNMNAYSFPY